MNLDDLGLPTLLLGGGLGLVFSGAAAFLLEAPLRRHAPGLYAPTPRRRLRHIITRCLFILAGLALLYWSYALMKAG